MSCEKPNEICGAGQCCKPCPAGQSPFGDQKTECIQNCPPGFLETSGDLGGGCNRPSFPRDQKPPLKCPINSTRITDQCWLDCPEGTVADFEICVPLCPSGFIENQNGAVCESEFVRRQGTPRAACFPGESRINNICYLGCPVGMTPYEADPALCRQVVPAQFEKFFHTEGFVSAKIKFGRTRIDAVCEDGYEPIGNACQSVCPLNSDALNSFCVVQCPTGQVQQGSSCSRALVQRNQATGSSSFFSSLLTIAGWIFGVCVVGFLLISILRSLGGNSQDTSAEAGSQ